MKGLVRIALLAAIVGSMLTTAWAGEETIGVKLRMWSATMGGDMRVDEDNILGTEIDIDDVLDMEKDDKAFEGVITFKPFHNSRFDLEYWSNNFDGETRLAQTFIFDGETYDLGTQVNSSMDMNVATLTYSYVISTPRVADIAIEAGPVIGVKLLDYEGSLHAVDAPVPFSAGEKFTTPAPVVGLRVTADLTKWITVEADVNGLKMSNIQDIDATLIDAHAEVTLNLWRGFYIGGGYHYFDIDVTDESGSSGEKTEVDFTLDGLYLSAGYRF
ncbi:MAG: hypothetical protein A2Z34_02715 [Planctomycetes bacterium RBG_16_59_8]|nr:MAG: hypothetical protein A2Z34_02715 [Planctomycetes bacterium RBG_16_59_8]